MDRCPKPTLARDHDYRLAAISPESIRGGYIDAQIVVAAWLYR
jgi:hypothetical protein